MTRYSRQELFSPIGPKGQKRIAKSRVLLVGCGALGTHLAEFCVRAGVGELAIIDRDVIEASNLQRQTLFTEDDLRNALPKAEAARRHLVAINGDVQVRAIVGEFSMLNAEKLAKDCSLILDATDNFETRFLINDVAVKLGLPWIYAACVSSTAAAMPVLPGKTACLTCLLEALPGAGGETCETAGIIMPSVLAAVSLAAVEALKILSGNENAVIAKLKSVDLWTGERTQIDASEPRKDCPVCGGRKFEHLAGKATAAAATMCGRDSVQLRPEGKFDFKAARTRLAKAAKPVASNDFLTRVGYEGLELTLFADGRAMVHGTTDIPRAKSLYAKLIGA
ncbi:MAG: ThiF family adenylyltransferase [Planctomycetes bacterium]|nr:ThiF family adenylyltransferase [Planctomycetota bacterium]